MRSAAICCNTRSFSLLQLSAEYGGSILTIPPSTDSDKPSVQAQNSSLFCRYKHMGSRRTLAKIHSWVQEVCKACESKNSAHHSMSTHYWIACIYYCFSSLLGFWQQNLLQARHILCIKMSYRGWGTGTRAQLACNGALCSNGWKGKCAHSTVNIPMSEFPPVAASVHPIHLHWQQVVVASASKWLDTI